MGGDAAWDLGLSHPDLWAGVIPIVATSDKYISRYWENAKFVPFYFVAAIHAGMDDMETAAVWLGKAYEQRDSWLSFLKIDPIWDCCRGEPQLEAMLSKVGLAG